MTIHQLNEKSFALLKKLVLNADMEEEYSAEAAELLIQQEAFYADRSLAVCTQEVGLYDVVVQVKVKAPFIPPDADEFIYAMEGWAEKSGKPTRFIVCPSQRFNVQPDWIEISFDAADIKMHRYTAASEALSDQDCADYRQCENAFGEEPEFYSDWLKSPDGIEYRVLF